MTKKQEIQKSFDQIMAQCARIQLFLEDALDADEAKKFALTSEIQKYYSKALKLMDIFGKDRSAEFKGYYEIDQKRKTIGFDNYVIQDFIKGIQPTQYKNFDVKALTRINLNNQLWILDSIKDRLDSVIQNVESELIAEFQNLELSSAISLLKINLRASGVLGGVILENHLSKIIDNHSLKIPKKNATLSDYNEFLKTNEVYGVTEWKKILYLSDLRNLCAHKKDNEPNETQVKELLDGVNWAIKNLF